MGHTLETRAKISAARRGKRRSPKDMANATAAAAIATRGVRFTEEHRAKIAESKRAAWARIPANARKASPAHRRKMSDSQAERWAKLSQQERSEIGMRWFEKLSPGEREAKMVTVRSGQRNRSTRIETRVAEELRTTGIVFAQQHAVGPFTVDFFLPEKSLVVEADGHYWHVRKPGAAERDAKRDAYLRSRGLEVLRLPERDIKAGAFDALRKAVA